RGDKVEKGQPLLITEAMKMETTIEARFAGTVDHIYVEEGEAISSGDLLLEVKEK
ncbi:MAG: biotin/lipoyl-containing protein, partial [Enterococcus faecalis]